MECVHNSFTLSMNVMELAVWVAALKRTIIKTTVETIPWKEDCFLRQLNDITRITGYGRSEYQEAYEFLEKKYGGKK